MTSTRRRLAAGMTLAAGLIALGGQARAAAPAGGYVVKMTNTEKQAVTAIYASAAGKNDWGDDLLGKQTAGAGRTVSLKFTAASPDACVQDLQMLMNDGKTVQKSGVNVCETSDYQFKQ